MFARVSSLKALRPSGLITLLACVAWCSYTCGVLSLDGLLYVGTWAINPRGPQGAPCHFHLFQECSI